MHAVVYARCSSDLQRDESITDQIRVCGQLASRQGWELTASYTDAAISGSVLLRGYQKLLEDARAGAFDLIIAEGLDRLGRDQEDVAALYKRLTFAGVKLITLAEGDVDAATN